MNISGNLYCWQGDDIYVNPNSRREAELGTIEFPYKTIDQAFIEVWNYWTDPTLPVNIYVMENTTNFVWYKTRPLLLYNRTTVRLKTYTERKVNG